MLPLSVRSGIAGYYTVNSTTNITATAWADFAPTWTEQCALPGVSESSGIFSLPVGYNYIFTANIGYEQYSGNNRQSVFMRLQHNIDSAGYTNAPGATIRPDYSRLTVHGDGHIVIDGWINAIDATTDCFVKIQAELETQSRLVRTNADWGTVRIDGMNY